MVHNVPLPCDSTNPAIIVNTSDNSDPARINFRMLRTESLEKKPDSFCSGSSFGRSSAGNCVADFIPSTSGLERQPGQSETATAPGRKLFIKASPLAIIAVDLEDRVILWNDSAERMFGWSENEVLGQALPIDPPGDTRLALENQPPSGPQHGIHSVRIRKDGVRIPVSIWTASIASNGGRLTVLADLTELREAERSHADLMERARAAQEEAVAGQRFSLLLEAAPDAIL